MVNLWIQNQTVSVGTLIQDIRSNYWQISTAGVGIVAEGLQDIRQCLDILLRTPKGASPLRPLFGCDIFQFADRPMSIAIPNVKRAILEAVEVWEKRVEIVSLTHQLGDQPGNVVFHITYQLANTEQTDLLTLYLQGGFLSTDALNLGALVVNAFFPPNTSGRRYRINLQRNGTNVLPSAPIGGFTTIADMFEWVRTNWSSFGRWHLLADRITGFLQADQFITASAQIELIGTLRFATTLPVLTGAGMLQTTFTGDDASGRTQSSDTFATPSLMLAWLQANWSQYGSWSIEGTARIPGDFSSEFDTDFFTEVDASYELVLLTDTLSAATISVSEV